ncbi:MAG: leucine-rich repeat domain-containing protein [Oscillospiraceae bacterium]|nr:leucine-rich repeat domain-containing protein [Oscillospiraceae bacterium]
MSQVQLQKYISRIMALIVSIMLLLPCIPVARADGQSGSCGANLSWTLSAGTLTISGSGDMTDFPEETKAPWYPYRSEILRLQLPQGLTSVGELAFYDCFRLTVVDIPDSVRSIAEYAFASCENISLLDLGNSLETIDTGAFYGCSSIEAIRFPEVLKMIGKDAFYMCTKLSTVTIPTSVISIGSAAFAYCTSLIRADLECHITKLPDWLFFGCEVLSTVILPETISVVGHSTFQQCADLYYVSYSGDNVAKSELEAMLNIDVPGFQTTGSITSSIPNSTSTTTKESSNEDNSVVIQDIIVIENTNSTSNLTTEHTINPEKSTISTNVTITVENEDGWQEAKHAVEEALKNHNNPYNTDAEVGNIEITVYAKDTETIDQSFLESIAGKDVRVTFITKDGSVWKIKGTDLDVNSELNQCNLRYDIVLGPVELQEKLDALKCYILNFYETGQVNVEVMIQLDPQLAFQTATLLQYVEADWVRIQHSVVDKDGYAHFYLAAVESDIKYCIGINLPIEENADLPIIPEEIQADYGDIINYQPIQYEITGRKSSWNMGLGKVMAILAVVMVSAVAVVGTVMFLWNKQRLKNGYVPNWDDEEE